MVEKETQLSVLKGENGEQETFVSPFSEYNPDTPENLRAQLPRLKAILDELDEAGKVSPETRWLEFTI